MSTETATGRAHGRATATLKLNATGRCVYHNNLPEGNAAREKILDHGIMDEVEFTAAELRDLVAVADRLRPSTDVHWQNTVLRVQTAARDAGLNPRTITAADAPN